MFNQSTTAYSLQSITHLHTASLQQHSFESAKPPPPRRQFRHRSGQLLQLLIQYLQSKSPKGQDVHRADDFLLITSSQTSFGTQTTSCKVNYSRLMTDLSVQKETMRTLRATATAAASPSRTELWASEKPQKISSSHTSPNAKRPDGFAGEPPLCVLTSDLPQSRDGSLNYPLWWSTSFIAGEFVKRSAELTDAGMVTVKDIYGTNKKRISNRLKCLRKSFD